MVIERFRRESGDVNDGKGVVEGGGGCSKILLTSNPISGPRIAGFAAVMQGRVVVCMS